MKQFAQLSPASQQVVLDLFGRAKGYQPILTNIVDPSQSIPNPETKRQFVLRLMQEYVVRVALDQRGLEATAAGTNDNDII